MITLRYGEKTFRVNPKFYKRVKKPLVLCQDLVIHFINRGGGSDLDDFMTPHAQKNVYNPNVKSTKNKTQFGENIDVAKLREDTMLHPDKVIYDSEHNIIKYIKEYDFNISTADTPTGSHRVFINLEPKAGKTNRNSQFPYYGGDK